MPFCFAVALLIASWFLRSAQRDWRHASNKPGDAVGRFLRNDFVVVTVWLALGFVRWLTLIAGILMVLYAIAHELIHGS